ncbi:glycosyltransferase family protein [Psychrobacter namhaensis]|uniref:glycosyltransferase n=1 Tax=Psychrobacter namhaensis TaxID=292734 RepID=UPI0018E03D88|nr:glycosyltransferase [Psychrobacter namhaensis]
MKILLLGEFSGLHKNLKEGLEEVGHEVDIASSGDGWKSIVSNIDLGSNYSNRYINRAHQLLKLLKNINKFRGYDIVQLIAPVVFPQKLGLNKFIIKYILRNNSKVFLVGAGATDTNSIIADFLQQEFKYSELYFKPLGHRRKFWSQTQEGRKYNSWLLDKIDGYIPIMYEYAQPYRSAGHPKLCSTIPIPMNLKKIIYKENVIKDKLVFFHGLNRPEVKGTALIREAFERLERNYPNEVECVIDGRMPLADYLKVLERANVIVDQVYSVSTGVNGVYGLALGKVVVGGGEPEFLSEFNLDTSPLIAIQPNVDSIYEQLEALVQKRKEISLIGYKSRLLAENLHDYRKVAEQYISVWSGSYEER